MRTFFLTEDNIYDYIDWIDMDMAENMERIFYRGLLILDDDEEKEPLSGLIYELVCHDSDEPKEAAIQWIKVISPEAAGLMFNVYKEMLSWENIERTTYIIPVKDSKVERTALEAAGFSLVITEGDSIVVSAEELYKVRVLREQADIPTVHELCEISSMPFNDAIAKCVALKQMGMCEDLDELSQGWFDQHLSCYSEKNGVVNGFFLFHRFPSGKLVMQLLTVLATRKEAVEIVPAMMRKFLVSLVKYDGKDAKVVLNRNNINTMLLTERLLPRGFGIPVYSGSLDL